MSENDQTCKHCRFWKHKTGNYGECRKYAPKPTKGFAKFAITSEITWCGQFEAKDGPSRQYH